MPKAIINNEGGRGLKWTRSVEDDICWEIGEHLNTRWSPDITGQDMLLYVDVLHEDAKFLENLLNNLHSGVLLETR